MPASPFDFSEYDRVVIGYHGTSAEQAERLVAGEPFKASDRDNEWFGEGVYFWEHAPKQAWWWAKTVRKHDRPAVVGAMIRLGNCLDLLDSTNVEVLKAFYAATKEQFASAGAELPSNHRRHKRLDCAIFNYFFNASDAQHLPIDTARAVYVPTDVKKRIWEGSWIHEGAHIQICVRSSKSIRAVWHVRQDGKYGKETKSEAQI